MEGRTGNLLPTGYRAAGPKFICSHRLGDGQAPPALFSLCILVASRSGPGCLEYRDWSQRMEPTVSLVRMLYEYGYHRSQIQPLLRLIEWMLRLIQRRFGPVDTETTRRIRAARVPELETWSLNTLDAATLDEVFGD